MSAEIAIGINGGDSSQVLCIEEKGSRNKRKFLSDPTLGDLNKPLQSEGHDYDYEFSAEQFRNALIDQHGLCEMCGCSKDNTDASKIELSLSRPVDPSDVKAVQPRVELKEIQDAEWSDFTENQLEELCLNNLASIFKSAIKKIAADGYSEDVATKAVLRTSASYGCKDTESNIVDNTLAILRKEREMDSPLDLSFENLEQLEKYTLAEMVCVLKEVNPLFNTGEAMWCLLICDMNVSHACAMDGDDMSCLGSNEAPGDGSSVPVVPLLDFKDNNSEENNPNTSNSNSTVPSPNGLQSELPAVKGIPNLPASKNSPACEASSPEQASPTSTSNNIKKSLEAIEEREKVKLRSSTVTEKLVSSRKGHSTGVRRESIIRQKIQLEKNYRGALRTGKLSGLGGLFLDKKLKAVSDSMGTHPKNPAAKVMKSIEANLLHAEGKSNISVNVGTSGSAVSNKKVPNTPPALPKANPESTISLPPKTDMTSNVTTSNEVLLDYSHYGIQYDKITGKWVTNDKHDEVILKLAAKRQDLQNQLGLWMDWANQKVMQATYRLNKDKSELKSLRKEKEEVERNQKERQSLEENTMRKLSEMENALSKTTEQVEQADFDVGRLEVDNAQLKEEMEKAKIESAEATANFEEVSKRENKMTKKLQSGEMQKMSLQEELAMLKGRRVQLEQEVEQAQKVLRQLEGRQKQVKREKEEVLLQAELIRKEKEQIEVSAKLKEDTIKTKSENNLQRLKDDIRNLETQIGQLKFATDSSKMAALLRGADGKYAGGSLVDGRSVKGSRVDVVFQEDPQSRHVKREQECVMCLTEERSVVFLPCAHQVVCTNCSEIHDKQGMKDCPSCRTPIRQRICARFYSSS